LLELQRVQGVLVHVQERTADGWCGGRAMSASAAPTPSADKPSDVLREYDAVLRYEAPFLIEKLLKERVVGTQEEGESLFTEVKRFLVLSKAAPDVLWNVYSARIDKVWHEFVLFTREYIEFCQRSFGGYVHHSPSNAPEAPSDRTSVESSTFRTFQAQYQALFGTPLPDSWFDERNVGLASRVLYDGVGRTTVSIEDGIAMLIDADGAVMLSVSDIAADALEFICRNGDFYVRELPGDLTAEERVGLISTLVEHRLLRVAP
jgi:hypothetical protein